MINIGLLKDVTQQKVVDTIKEIERAYPDVRVSLEVCPVRGIITACHGRFMLSVELVETERFLDNYRLLMAFASVLLVETVGSD